HSARTKPFPEGKAFTCTCHPGTARPNDIAATAFALLPFLGAGHTHKSSPKIGTDYKKTIDAGLRFLVGKQDKTGYFGREAYTHPLATIAVCEAYGLTSDPTLKRPAQLALDSVERWQDPRGGGWRYEPKMAGDTSVTGWMLMGLKSGQMAGLNVSN